MSSFSIEALRTQMHDLAEPYRKQLEEVEQEILERSETLDELRQLRTELTRALRAIDPTSQPTTSKNGKGNVSHVKNIVISDAMVRQTDQWLRAHRDELPGNGFTASDLVLRHGAKFASQSTVSSALRVLHDRGVIRLDRRGVGGGRIYKLVG